MINLAPAVVRASFSKGACQKKLKAQSFWVFSPVTTGKGISEFAESHFEVPIKAFLTEVTLESRL